MREFFPEPVADQSCIHPGGAVSTAMAKDYTALSFDSIIDVGVFI
jgi:hypothetical protein